ncbi:hypothetical protein GQ607_017955 [Colletotrichum asianum]|uniref:Hemocyanin C-terminal domain-containing protein n=1 Tax=Colletotrichum asianum TaxID=702518 RepID=A0A8H3ZDA3_9PEZI|nr:hypothetical protein GQ607_017955 [Colletotrichum asianum]
MLRDPAHYQIYKRLEHYFKRYKNYLPRYTHEELDFPGVKVENVEVGKLITYFDYFEIDLDNVVTVGKEEDGQNVDIRGKVARLNHKPFTYSIHINSDKNQDVYIRVFLGPKYNHLGQEYELDERRDYFVEVDRFPYKIEAGKNIVERKSQDSNVVAPDQDSYRTFFKKITEAYEGKAEYYLNKAQHYYGYPERLLVPKGKKGGQAFTFYVIVTPYHQVNEKDFQPYDHKAFSYMGVGQNRVYPDDKPLGYPFDRKIYSNDFYTPNQYFKDVVIFHKKADEDSNVTQN